MRSAAGLSAALAVLAAGIAHGATAPTVGAGSPLDAAVQAAAGNGLAGEVLASNGEATVYARAISAPGRPHHTGERWRWASVSKQVAALFTMQEVASGKLSLDDTVAACLPAFKGPTAGAITVRMLLQHTSGLPNPDDTPTGAAGVPAFYTAEGPQADPRRTALGLCAGPPKTPPQTGPDARFSYNNCDTLVLQAILERETGRTFAALVAERLKVGAGLTDVGVFPPDPAEAPPSVRGVTETGAPEPQINLGVFGAAGSIYGPPEDLLAFDRALMAGRLLPAGPAREAMWTGDPRLGYVALGAWAFPAKLKGCPATVKLVERRGEIGGVEVRNLIAPDLDRALVVFADRVGLDFGEIWQGKGLTYDLASAAFCA